MIREVLAGSPKTLVFPKSDWEQNLRRFENFFRHNYVFTDDPASLDPESVDYVIPLSTKSFEQFVNVPSLSKRIVSPSPEAMRICNDKAAFHTFFSPELADFLPTRDAERFPLIAKPRVGANSEGCEIIRDQREWKSFLDRGAADYVFEEYVPGDREYATHIVANDGIILEALCLEYVYEHSTPLKGLHPSHRRIAPERFADVIARFLRKLSYTGICCVNYKIRNGVPVIFEINPRVGGSCSEYLFGFVRHLAKVSRVHGVPEIDATFATESREEGTQDLTAP